MSNHDNITVQGTQMWMPSGKDGGEMDWETGLDVRALLILRIKLITNENLLHRSGSSTQCSAVTKLGRESKNKGIYVCVEVIHFAVQWELI